MDVATAAAIACAAMFVFLFYRIGCEYERRADAVRDAELDKIEEESRKDCEARGVRYIPMLRLKK